MKPRLYILLLACISILVASATAEEKAAERARTAKPKMVIAALEHSFGKVKPGTPLTYSFTVKNEGDADLQIMSVSPSCGCTTSEFDKVVPPGKAGKITLEIKKTDGYKGEVVKSAAVTTNDESLQSIALLLRANFTTE